MTDGGAGNDKAALRRAMRQRVSSLDPDQARRSAREATERILRLPEVEGAPGVLICLSFGVEIDTSGLLEQLLASGREVFVPRSDLASSRLHLHPYPCELETLRFGLEQPVVTAPELAPESIDRTIGVALIVGLAFDRRGYRLGYGKGLFDRFLADRPFPAVGLAHDLQLIDEVPAETHDIPMAVVVTATRTLRPAAGTR